MAYSGVHGTITLAMAFSLPLTLNGQKFPYRNDIIFVAAVVILTSLLVPTLILPKLLPQRVSKYTEDELAKIKGQMVDNAIVTLQTHHDNFADIGRIINILDGQRSIEGSIDKNKLAIIFDNCFELEQQTIDEMLNNGEISEQSADLYMRVARRTALQHQNSLRQRILLFIRFHLVEKVSLTKAARKRRKMYHKMQSERENISREQMLERNRQLWDKMAQVEKKPYAKITSYLNQSLINDSANNSEISIARRAYDERHSRLIGKDNFESNQDELLIEAFQQENTYIQI